MLHMNRTRMEREQEAVDGKFFLHVLQLYMYIHEQHQTLTYRGLEEARLARVGIPNSLSPHPSTGSL